MDFYFNEKEATIKLNDGLTYPLESKEAFNALSKAWIRCGWDTKYVYGFSWLGRPIIQLPEDLLRIQELIYKLKPTLIIETGVAHGGSLIFYASLFKSMDHEGRVIGIDIDIRDHNRKEIENHYLYESITLIEGSSIDRNTIDIVKNNINEEDNVLVILDSNHLKDHVLKELEYYSSFVSKDSYIVACDGIMKDVVGAPRTQEDWIWNNPISAIDEFISKNSHFKIDEPVFPFNEGLITDRVTYWPKAFLKRIK